MKTNSYLPPEVDIIEIELEGTLCVSYPTQSNSLDIFEDDGQAW